MWQCMIINSSIVCLAIFVDFNKCFDAIQNGTHEPSGGVEGLMSKDNQPQFSMHTPLHTELMLDMCALLSMYLASLLEPMLSSTLFEGFGSGDPVILGP